MQQQQPIPNEQFLERQAQQQLQQQQQEQQQKQEGQSRRSVPSDSLLEGQPEARPCVVLSPEDRAELARRMADPDPGWMTTDELLSRLSARGG